MYAKKLFMLIKLNYLIALIKVINKFNHKYVRSSQNMFYPEYILILFRS